MREILFRGKRIDNGEWVVGIPWIFTPPVNKAVIVYAMGLVGEDDDTSRYCECHEVDPSTIGQYTGLTDKNGKKIFEGNIVKGFYKPTDKLVCGSVKYENHLARMLILNRGVCAGLSHCHHVEVIGNIHDDPELLEGKP